MGRHETFGSAIALTSDLLAGTMLGRAPSPDPVDTAIERHRAAREELQRATKGIDAAMSASKRAAEEADAAFCAASDVDGAAWADLIATRPADLPGAVRLLRYVSASPATEIVDDPQDLLRQLTAAVEAAEAGEGTADTVLAAGGPMVPIAPDPVFEVIAEFQEAWDAFGEAVTAAKEAPVPEVVEEDHDLAYDRLREVRPTTAAGFRALAETWARRLGDDFPGETVGDHAAASLIAGAGVCVPIVSGASVSPALADLITRHRDLLRQANADELSDEASDTLFDKAWDLFRQACSLPVAGTADVAAKLDLVAAEITESVERGRTDAAAHAWRCIRADLLGLGTLEGLSAATAVAGARVLAGGVHHDDGTVSYSDAGGKVWRQPVAQWIAFVAMQLHSCARTEMGRLRVAHNGLPGEQLDALEASARRGLRLDALVALTQPPERKPAAEAVDWRSPPPGFMASPAIEPSNFVRIPDGIAIELERLRGIALAEFDRRAATRGTAEGAERLRRDLRLDALEKAVRGEGGYSVGPAVSRQDPQGPDPRLVALVAAWEVAERAGNALGLSDGERTPHIDRASDLLREIYAFPARTLADLCAKLPAYRDEATGSGDAPDNADEEAPLEAHALHGLVADLERLACAGAAVPHPDAALFALGVEFLAAWVTEARAGDATAYEAVNVVASRIARAPAVTAAGLGIKALLLARLQSEDTSPLAPETAHGPVWSMWNVLRQVQEGAVRFGGATAEPALPPIGLAAAIEEAWAAYAAADHGGDGAGLDAALARRDALIEAADALPADTIEARHAKALALAWIVAEDSRDDAGRGNLAADGRLAVDLHAALARLAPPQVQDADEIPTALAAACAWAAEREARVNAPGGTDGMNEAQLDAALRDCDGVWDRAIAEPSASSADIAAKARLLLPDAERRARSADACRDDRLVPVILREIAALGDAS